jgi:hypothetical protein
MSRHESITFKQPDGQLLPLDEVLRNVRAKYDELIIDEQRKIKWIEIAASGSVDERDHEEVVKMIASITLDARTLKAAVASAVKSDNYNFIWQLVSHLQHNRQLTTELTADYSMSDYFLEHAIDTKSEYVCEGLLDCVTRMFRATVFGRRRILNRTIGIKGNQVLTNSLIKLMKADTRNNDWPLFGEHLLINDRIEPLLNTIETKSRFVDIEFRTKVAHLINFAATLPSRKLHDQLVSACLRSQREFGFMHDIPDVRMEYSLSKINPSVLASNLREGKTRGYILNGSDCQSDTFWVLASLYVSARDAFDKLKTDSYELTEMMDKAVCWYNDLMFTLSDLTCDDLAQLTGQYLFALEPANL